MIRRKIDQTFKNNYHHASSRIMNIDQISSRAPPHPPPPSPVQSVKKWLQTLSYVHLLDTPSFENVSAAKLRRFANSDALGAPDPFSVPSELINQFKIDINIAYGLNYRSHIVGYN